MGAERCIRSRNFNPQGTGLTEASYNSSRCLAEASYNGSRCLTEASYKDAGALR